MRVLHSPDLEITLQYSSAAETGGTGEESALLFMEFQYF